MYYHSDDDFDFTLSKGWRGWVEAVIVVVVLVVGALIVGTIWGACKLIDTCKPTRRT